MKSQNMFSLTGKVAIVTGASKGIGAAIASTLAAFGAKVVVSSRSQEAVDKVAEEIISQGGIATGIACHVGKEEQLQALVKKTTDLYGRIDILVNNAATNPVFGPIQDMENAIFDKVMSVNVKSPMLLANLVYPIMKKGGGGSIINIASVEGSKPTMGLSVYSISKAALIMLTKSQATEWGKDGIRSNTISPGLVKTKFSKALWMNDAALKMIEKLLPSGRMAQPIEMAGLCVFLASDAASYCTGSEYTADGGYMIAGGLA